MLDHPTLNRLRALKRIAPQVRLRRNGMADALAELQQQEAAADLSHAEWLGLLIDREADSRSTRRYQSRMTQPISGDINNLRLAASSRGDRIPWNR